MESTGLRGRSRRGGAGGGDAGDDAGGGEGETHVLVPAQAQEVNVLGRFAELAFRNDVEGPVEAVPEDENPPPEVVVAGGGAAAPLTAGATAGRFRGRGGGGDVVPAPSGNLAGAGWGRGGGSAADAQRRGGGGGASGRRRSATRGGGAASRAVGVPGDLRLSRE